MGPKVHSGHVRHMQSNAGVCLLNKFAPRLQVWSVLVVEKITCRLFRSISWPDQGKFAGGHCRATDLFCIWRCRWGGGIVFGKMTCKYAFPRESLLSRKPNTIQVRFSPFPALPSPTTHANTLTEIGAMSVFHICNDRVSKAYRLIPENCCIETISVLFHALHTIVVASVVGLKSKNIIR